MGLVLSELAAAGSLTELAGLGVLEENSLESLPQKPVPLPSADAIRKRIKTGDCNAYIARLLAKATELFGRQGNVAVAKDGLDLLQQITSQGQGGFELQDFLTIEGWPVAGTVTGSIKGNSTSAAGSATVLISTRFMMGNSRRTLAYWQADYIDTAIHEMLHLAGKYAGYTDRELAVAASSLQGASAGLPAATTDPQNIKTRFKNSDYYDHELKKHCGGK
jgi:hypothetical protein